MDKINEFPPEIREKPPECRVGNDNIKLLLCSKFRKIIFPGKEYILRPGKFRDLHEKVCRHRFRIP